MSRSLRALAIAQLRAHRSAPARPVIGWAPTLDPLVPLSGIAARRSLAVTRASGGADPTARTALAACGCAEAEYAPDRAGG